jgi:hypothetical protein
MNFNQSTDVERAEGDVPADAWATAIIKVSCILVIGVVIINGIVGSINLTTWGPFSGLLQTVETNVTSGYTLGALMVLALGAGAIMHFLGFM